MKPMRVQIAAVWVAVQIVFFAGWAYTEAARFEQGRSILVRTLPVDPRDLLRGQYFRLAYEMSRPDEVGVETVDAPEGSTVWMVLKPDGEFHVPARVSLTRPSNLGPDEEALRGRLEGRGDFGMGSRRIVYGIERYFVPEGTPTPREGEITVRLRVTEDGVSRIEEVYLDGQAWP